MILLHTLLHYYTFLINFFHLTSIFLIYRHREEEELVVRKREVMNDLYWWYRDAEDNETLHGPFESEKMLTWYDHGYFTSELVVWWCFHADGRNGLKRIPSTIEQLFSSGPGGTTTSPTTDIKIEIFSLAFHDALEESYWVESIDPSTNKKYYYNIKTEISAWELPTVTNITAETASGVDTTYDTGQSTATTAGNEEGTSSTYTDDIEHDLGTRSYIYNDADKWYYKDASDAVQGPFHADDMRAWMDAGYFT